ncbi:MAG TPA: ABC transporter permease subunit [Thermoleophilaceae bacterium]|jgi:ABC-type transport system involved in multi-copper enzyme maturation permease subunit|nr:ABC transporter permease subunit [Thermoleophilaceae bacterium]
MTDVATIASYAIRESVRRRVFLVVLVLTLAFGGLYAAGAAEAFHRVREFSGQNALVNAKVVTGSTIFGLAMFGTLFLGAVLAAFLTLSAVRGDAERGLLQPLVVRPVGRTALLAGRLLAAAAVCAGYVLVVYFGSLLLTGAIGGWWPDRIVGPGLGLALGVVVIASLSLLGSVFLSATANGIAVFMVFGAGLVAGLLGQIGEALAIHSLEQIAKVASWLVPFEALYQSGLDSLTADQGGFTGAAVRLGPFGGAQHAGPLLWLWAVAYLVLVAGLARTAFARRDL